MKMEQSVPKRRHINFGLRGITQKKAYNFQYKAKSRIFTLFKTHKKCRKYCPGLSIFQSAKRPII